MFNILLTGDWHLTPKTPENRTDNFRETCLRKVECLRKIAADYDVKFVIQPGDLFDNHTVPNEFMVEVISAVAFFGEHIPILTVYGQHDLRYRNRGNTSLDVLDAALNNLIILNGLYEYDDCIAVYGASYGEEIPEIVPGKALNILVLHRMIVDEKIWEEQKEFDWGTAFLRRNKFDIIVSGDNHKSFIIESPTKKLFNCGSLLRSTTKQINHTPYCVVYDLHTGLYKTIHIPIDPSETVFKMEEVIKEKEKNEHIKAFVDGLNNDEELGMKFEDNMLQFIDLNNIEKEVADILISDMRE